MADHADGERDGVALAPSEWFYANHLGKFVLFSLLGGYLFCVYWSYRSWRAYVANWGYSRAPFWREVRARTGYLPSPFWRTAFFQGYVLCLFPAVDRECRARGLKGVRAAELIAILLPGFVYAQGQCRGIVDRCLLSPVWLMLPVQVAINRLHRREGRSLHFRTNGWEIAWVALGALSFLRK